MIEYFILLQGSYDSAFVGPFSTRKAALKWCDRIGPEFDTYPHTQRQMAKSVAAFGPLPIYKPDEYAP